MSGDPTVSVVIPTHHRATLLARVLHGLAHNTPAGRDLEVVVVVDHLDDDGYAAVARASDVRPQLLRQANAGPAAARNRGWRHATGEVIAFLDDDAVPGDLWLHDVTQAFADDRELAALGGRIEPIWPTNVIAAHVTRHGHLDHSVDSHQGVQLIGANLAVRRSALVDVGGFDERFRAASGEDWDLCRRLTASGHRLGTTTGAVVLHHHPRTLAEMVATAHRYGTSTTILGATSPVVVAPEPPTGARGLLPSKVLTAARRARHARRVERRAGSGPLHQARGVGLELLWWTAHSRGASASR